MLMGEYYHEGLKTVIATFGSLFNDVVIHRYTDFSDSTPDVDAYLRVPIAFGQVDKMLARVRATPSFNNKELITLPRMSYDIGSMSYDSTRKLNKMHNVYTRDLDGTLEQTWTPVPYDISINLYALTTNLEDCLQIVEQIVPFFQPDFNVQIVELGDINRDMKFTLTSVDISDDYEGDFESTRYITATLSFVVKAQLYGPLNTTKIIKKSMVNILTPSWDCYQLSETVVPFSAEESDPHIVESKKGSCYVRDTSAPYHTSYITKCYFSEDNDTYMVYRNYEIANKLYRPIYNIPLRRLFRYYPEISDWAPDDSSIISTNRKMLSYDLGTDELLGITSDYTTTETKTIKSWNYLPIESAKKSKLMTTTIESYQVACAYTEAELNSLMTSRIYSEIYGVESGSLFTLDSSGIWNTNPEPKFRDSGVFLYDLISNTLGYFDTSSSFRQFETREIINTISSNKNIISNSITIQTMIFDKDGTSLDTYTGTGHTILDLSKNETHIINPITGVVNFGIEFSPNPNTIIYDEISANFWYVPTNNTYMRITQ
jgi:hypothetical protein